MTDSTRPSPGSGTDYQNTVSVDAAPDAVYAALTTTAGLTAWWAPCTGSGATGGELTFRMNAPDPLLIRVDQATRATAVHWTVTDCPFVPDWVGTCPTFSIATVAGGRSELRFRHIGLTADLDCFDQCVGGWDHFLESLRRFAETGQGMPLGSPADQARRPAAAPTA